MSALDSGEVVIALVNAAVDLEAVHGELLEVGERGVAGAEVVDGDPHAKRLDGLESPRGRFGVAHQGGLGDLDDQRARRRGRWS